MANMTLLVWLKYAGICITTREFALRVKYAEIRNIIYNFPEQANL